MHYQHRDEAWLNPEAYSVFFTGNTCPVELLSAVRSSTELCKEKIESTDRRLSPSAVSVTRFLSARFASPQKYPSDSV